MYTRNILTRVVERGNGAFPQRDKAPIIDSLKKKANPRKKVKKVVEDASEVDDEEDDASLASGDEELGEGEEEEDVGDDDHDESGFVAPLLRAIGLGKRSVKAPTKLNV